MNKVVAPLVATLVLGAAPAYADTDDTAETANAKPATSLSLADTLQVAVRQSPPLARARIDISVAEASMLESLGIDDWVLTGTGAISIVEQPDVSSNVFAAAKSYNAALSLARSLPTGGLFSATVSGGARDALVCDEMFNCGRDTLKSGAITLRLEHSLMRGAGRDVARSVQKRAEIAKDSAQLAQHSVALETVKGIIDAYWEVAYAAKEIEIRRGSLDLAKEQLRITNAGISAGATAPTASLPLEQGILVREEAILVAEVTLSNLSLALRRVAGLEVGPGEIDIAATDSLDMAERDYDLDATIARALERNPTVGLIELAGKDARVEVIVTENGLKPILDVAVVGGPEGEHVDTGEVVKQIGGFDAYSVNATVTYQQQLGNRAAKGARRRAELQAHRVEINLEEARRNIAADVTAAVNEVRAAKRRIEVSAKAIELAEQNLINEKASFDAGNSTNFDILRRQEEIEQAKLTHSRALVDHRKAVAKVDALTGDLLERYGITIEAEDR